MDRHDVVVYARIKRSCSVVAPAGPAGRRTSSHPVDIDVACLDRPGGRC